MQSHDDCEHKDTVAIPTGVRCKTCGATRRFALEADLPRDLVAKVSFRFVDGRPCWCMDYPTQGHSNACADVRALFARSGWA